MQKKSIEPPSNLKHDDIHNIAMGAPNSNGDVLDNSNHFEEMSIEEETQATSQRSFLNSIPAPEHFRPLAIGFIGCDNVLISDISIVEGVNYGVRLQYSTRVEVRCHQI